MVDNFRQIEKLLDFKSEDEFYFVQILQRKKDHQDSNKRLGRNNSSRLIKAYYITSLDRYKEYEEEIKALCDLFKARAGINLNKRSFRFATMRMLEKIAKSIAENNHYNARLWNTVCGEYAPTKDKLWILDVDNVNRVANEIILFAERECLPEGNKFISVIPSRNGYHIIMKPFDLSKFSEKYPEVEVHKNNPTNLYISDI